MRISVRSLPSALCALLVALVCGTPVHAHEIGTTRVSVAFHEDRTYDIEIVTDAATLVEKLEASKGSSALSGFDDETFIRRVKLTFDAVSYTHLTLPTIYSV